jgi:hypothetical protein
MLIPTTLIGAVLICAMVGALIKYRDTFHPALLIGPMLGFHYVYSPFALQASNGFFGYLTEEHVTHAQWVHLGGVVAMCLGLSLGPLPGKSSPLTAADTAKLFDGKTLLWASLIFAALGITSFVYGIENVGGWTEAYGAAYGGGWIESGWLRDLVLLCLPALMLFTLGEGDRPITRRQLTLALPMVSPFLVHGLIGARRGPTFMTVAGAAMVFYMARRRRPQLPTLLIGGGLLGVLMLVLVANRNSIYWGADLNANKVDTETSAYLRQAEGNDFIYGAGLVIVTDEMHDFSWGSTYLTTLLVRPIPKSIWPTKYEDAAAFFGRPLLTQNLGIDITSFRTVLGWTATVGAAPGIIGDMWREFSWGMLPVLFGIAWFYSNAWWRAVNAGGAWVPIYCFAASLSLYLVMQTLEAMLYRFLFGLIPMLFVLRLAAKKAREKARRAELEQPEAEPATAPTLVAST